MLVRECKGEKYLSSSIDDSSIDEIDDIIIDDPSSTDASGIIGSVEHLQNTHVMGVNNNSSVYNAAQKLFAKILILNFFKMSHPAKIMIKTPECMPVTLLALDEIVKKITGLTTERTAFGSVNPHLFSVVLL